MAEYDIREEIFNRDFLQGFFNDRVVKGLTLTPFLSKQVLDADTFTWIEEDMGVEEQIKKGLMHEPRQLPEGARLQEIRMEGIHTKQGSIKKRGFAITISKNLLERDPTVARSLLNRMGKMAYSLGRWVEKEVYTNVKASAISDGINDPEGDALLGDDGDLESALVDLQTAYDNDEYVQTLNTLLYYKTDLAGVRKQLNANEIVTQNRLIKGWENGSAFDYMGLTHMRGNMFQTPKELIGFDRNIDFGTVFYGKEEGAYNPEVKTGMEHFAPLINVTVQKPESWMIPKEYTIRMLASCGVSIDTPRALLYKPDVTIPKP